MAAERNHLIAVIKVPENYDSLIVAMGDIRNEVEVLTHISVGNIRVEIEWFLGGDWKFSCVCGLGAAHATCPCIWCKCPLYDHFDGTKTWSLIDTSNGARTKEILELARAKKPQFNVKHAPLFPSIPLIMSLLIHFTCSFGFVAAYYDQRKPEWKPFEVGQTVWLKHPKHWKFGGKWVGPYEITSRIGVNYKTQAATGEETVVHHNLKPCSVPKGRGELVSPGKETGDIQIVENELFVPPSATAIFSGETPSVQH